MSSRDIRLCFVGDSFVNGTGDPTYLGWVGRVCAMAATRGYAVTAYNLGIRRQTSVEVAQRWLVECAQRLPPEVDGRVIFSFGVNDMTVEGGRTRVGLAETAQATHQILTQATPRLPTLMIGPPPVADPEHNARIQGLDQILQGIATRYDVPYLSIFPQLITLAMWRREVAANDGAHPRADGYAYLASLIDQWPAWWFHRAAAVTAVRAR